jgi:hypothetical protein
MVSLIRDIGRFINVGHQVIPSLLDKAEIRKHHNEKKSLIQFIFALLTDFLGVTLKAVKHSNYTVW